MADEQNQQQRRDAKLIARLEQLAWLLDTSLPIPFTRFRAGLDAVLGLIPVVGDAAGALLSLGIVAGAYRLGVPWRVLVPMLGNVAIETIVGAIPLVGDLFDIGYKANRRNVQRLIDHVERRSNRPTREWSTLGIIVVAILATAFVAGLVFVALLIWSVVTALLA
ncbi:MAG: DUF4112 domain-containing protein [Pseudomonadota bacterium]